MTGRPEVGIGSASIDESLSHWVNDRLMTMFLFVISFEVKRQFSTGDLSREET